MLQFTKSGAAQFRGRAFKGGDEKDYNDFEKIIALNQPKKPVKSDKQVIRYVQTYECPNCGRKFTGNIMNYCYHCGQKLDWSDEMDSEER